MVMTLISKMNISELQAEAIDNDELLAHLGGFDVLGNYTETELRDKIQAWIVAGDECAA
jgi:hypothetical protein